jgi:hypothetical protein
MARITTRNNRRVKNDIERVLCDFCRVAMNGMKKLTPLPFLDA